MIRRTESSAPHDRVAAALAYCVEPQHLRRTLTIAVVVGVLLTLINQGAVIFGGQATTATWIRSALNFVVPFCVSNAGLLSARRSTGGLAGRPETDQDHRRLVE